MGRVVLAVRRQAAPVAMLGVRLLRVLEVREGAQEVLPLVQAPALVRVATLAGALRIPVMAPNKPPAVRRGNLFAR